MHTTSLLRRIALAAALGAAFVPGPAGAADTLTWIANTYQDASNRTVASLIYGVPESDVAQFYATCPSPTGSEAVEVLFGTDVGKLKEGQKKTLDIRIGSYRKKLPGRVYGTQLEEGTAGILTELAYDDGFWTALEGKGTVRYSLPGGDTQTMSLAKVSKALTTFRTDCESLLTGNDGGSNAGGDGDTSGAEMTFTCDADGGIELKVTVVDNGQSAYADIVHDGHLRRRLKQMPAASGAFYSDGTYELHMKGDGALFSWPDGEQSCTRR